MVLKGHIENGAVVFDPPVVLPEGATVRVEVEQPPVDKKRKFSELLLEIAGTAEGLPPDAALNHDHYLYGAPKK